MTVASDRESGVAAVAAGRESFVEDTIGGARVRDGRPLIRSLGAKILALCLGFVLLPSVIFALLAFSGARNALEDAVAVQLTQAAEEGAAAVDMALTAANGEARLWAQQDLMRELVIGDVDKRVSRFLASIRESNPAYLDIVCAAPDGQVVAASTGHWLGRRVDEWPAFRLLRDRREVVSGRRKTADGERDVVDIGVRIPNPDAPGEDIGVIILLYDWQHALGLLAPVRDKLTRFGKQVAVYVRGTNGEVLGRLHADGDPGRDFAAADVMVGEAPVTVLDASWTIAMVQPRAQALLPVADLRRRWTLALLVVVLISLGIAVVAARRVVRPLREVTEATRRLASGGTDEPQLVAVRSRDEIGELAQAFNSMAGRLRQAQEKLVSTAKLAFAGELAAGVAHEVRTPLTVMRSSAQMLLDSASPRSASDAELLATLVAEVDRVEHVVSGLVELAKPGPQRLEPTRLEDVLSHVARFIDRQARAGGVTIDTEFANTRRALCDPDQIYQVVLNLAVNALQALRAGGRIVLRTADGGGDMTCFEVEDDGPGVPEPLAQRVFDPFVTGRDGGTGLGLALVRRVVESHHGSVELRNRVGRGAAFRVCLPAAGEPQ
jgi:signal transduction histidine kinase